jgi:hypothetical protein
MVKNFGLLGKEKGRINTGKVIDPVSDKPVKAASIEIQLLDPDEDYGVVKTLSTKSGRDGSFSLEVPYSETGDGKYRSKLNVEKRGYDYINVSSRNGDTCLDIDQDMTNFAVREYEYQLAAASNRITVNGTLSGADGEPLAGETVVLSGLYHSKTCAKGCCGDFSVYDVEYNKELKTDRDGRFSLKVPAKFLFGLKHSLKIDNYDKSYRALFTKGITQKTREIETDEGSSLTMKLTVDSRH